MRRVSAQQCSYFNRFLRVIYSVQHFDPWLETVGVGEAARLDHECRVLRFLKAGCTMNERSGS